MDGASKFVKGDAIAGILILVINLLGGLIIGLWQYQLSFEQAAESYILLSIGDGLVAHPSLLLAIATAIIVTRVSTKHDMAENIGLQIGMSRAWLPVSAVFAVDGFHPRYAEWIISGGGIICWHHRLPSKATRACCTG